MKLLRSVLIAAALVTAAIALAQQPQAPKEVIIKALVDGTSELVVTTNGLHWKTGIWAKPGRHGGKSEPTYVNDEKWFPKWQKPREEYGEDTSDEFPIHFESVNLDFELLAIGTSPNATNIEVRSAPTTSYGANSFNVNIPDPELGSRWYVFALTERPAATNSPDAKK